jgi:CO/xanthine dehydrogenase Mo-binding subunit
MMAGVIGLIVNGRGVAVEPPGVRRGAALANAIADAIGAPVRAMPLSAGRMRAAMAGG